MNRTSNDMLRNNSHIPSEQSDLQFPVEDNVLDMTGNKTPMQKRKKMVPDLNLTAQGIGAGNVF